MSRALLIEEFHISVTVPRGLRPIESAGMRRTLIGNRFRRALRDAVRDLQRRHPMLAKATLRLSA
jgi:hypothetical protein